MELFMSWDTLDRNTQRYVATTVAGSRQQSRFLLSRSVYEQREFEDARHMHDRKQMAIKNCSTILCPLSRARKTSFDIINQ